MNKPTYTLSELTEYLAGKYEMNYTDVCYITKETVQKIELTFKPKPSGLRRWLKPIVSPLIEEKKKVTAYT